MISREDHYSKDEIIKLFRENKDGIDIPNTSPYAMDLFRGDLNDPNSLFVKLVDALEKYDKEQVDSFRKSLADALRGASESRANAIKQAIEAFNSSSSKDKFDILMNAIQVITASVNISAVANRAALRKKLREDWANKLKEFEQALSKNKQPLTLVEQRILSPLTALYTVVMTETLNDPEQFSDESVDRFHESLLTFAKTFYKKLIKLTRAIEELTIQTESNFKESLQDDFRVLLKNSIKVLTYDDERFSLDVSSFLEKLNMLKRKIENVSFEKKDQKKEQQMVVDKITALIQLVEEKVNIFQKNVNVSHTHQPITGENKKEKKSNKSDSNLPRFASWFGKTTTKPITTELKANSVDSGLRATQTTTQTTTVTSTQTTTSTPATPAPESSTTKKLTPRSEQHISFSQETKSEDEESTSAPKPKEPPPLRRSPATFNLWETKLKKMPGSPLSSSNPDASSEQSLDAYDKSDEAPEKPNNSKP